MAITHTLGPNPKWYFADINGRPLGGGYLVPLSSLNNELINYVYMDSFGTNKWPMTPVTNVGKLGILLEANGTQGPFYWQYDSDLPNNLYYIEVYDSTGVLQWTINNYAPGSGGGGGGGTQINSLTNYVVNNVFYDNIVATANPITTTETFLAPGAHAGLTDTTSLFYPDIWFFKNNTSALDQITFPAFTPGNTPFGTDVTPTNYLNYVCGNTPTAESYKYIQIPITQGVQNISNQAIGFSIWAMSTVGTINLTCQIVQFFGDGTAASANVSTPIATFTVGSTWQKFVDFSVIPSISGKSLGQCGNDGVFLQILLPLDQACNISFTKPCLYLNPNGSFISDNDYTTYDMIDSIINTPRTGDIKDSMSRYLPGGWISCNDGTIGNSSSNATSRAQNDTFPLFNELWHRNSAYNPIYDSAGVAVVKGASPVDDYNANRAISLPALVSRTQIGTPRSGVNQNFTVNISTSTSRLNIINSTSFNPYSPLVLSNSGGALPVGLSASLTYYPIIVNKTQIQLALAPAGTPVTFSSNGTGTNTVQLRLSAGGTALGEFTHILTVAELPPHTHNYDRVTDNTGPGGLSFGNQVLAARATTSTGSGVAHNNVQPSTYLYRSIKL